MSLADTYNHALHSQMRAHAVWWPIIDEVEVGAYGIIRAGVFHRFGNIRSQFGVDYESRTAPAAAFNYSSEGVSTSRFHGDAEVASLANGGDADARLRIEFARAKSVFVRIASVQSATMDAIDGVANSLLKTRGWDPRFKVVSRVYVANGGTILAAEESDTTLEFTGRASLLEQVEVGAIETQVTFESSSKRSLQIVGEKGAFGLNMFHLARRFWLFGERIVKPLSGEGREDDAIWEGSDQWSAQLSDDV